MTKVFIPHYSDEVEKRVLKEKVTMKEPDFNYQFPPDGPTDSLLNSANDDYMERCRIYEQHIDSRQTIPMPDMTPEFGKREEVVEWKDFSFIYQFKHLPSSTEWHNCPESVYEAESKETRRIIAIAIEGKPDRERGVTVSTGEEAKLLLKEVLDFHYGKGKYNFSRCPEDQQANDAFDAWLELRSEIENFLDSTTSKPKSVEQPVGEQEVDEDSLKRTWNLLRTAIFEMLLSVHSDEWDKPYVSYGNRVYTRNQLADEVKNGTKDGTKTIEQMVALTIDLCGRGKKQLFSSTTTLDAGAVVDENWIECRRVLEELVYLKSISDIPDYANEYQQRKPKAWADAKIVIGKLNSQSPTHPPKSDASVEQRAKEYAKKDFEEWERLIPDPIRKVLNDFALGNTYPVRGVLRNLYTKALAGHSSQQTGDAVTLTREQVVEFANRLIFSYENSGNPAGDLIPISNEVIDSLFKQRWI